jgi:3-phosphoshikimate 1-carboxyvinyltransferase
MSTLPDSAQTLAIVASVAKGETKITGIANLKVKETNRIFAMKTELAKCGINVEVGDDYMLIEGGKPSGAQISTYNDHRMAMSFGVLGTKISGIKIENPNCVSKPSTKRPPSGAKSIQIGVFDVGINMLLATVFPMY